jgi:hypothetical protein
MTYWCLEKQISFHKKCSYCWRVSSSGIWSRVVRRVSTDVSEEHKASIFTVEKISSAKTSLPPACLMVFAELISSTLKMEAICSSETSVETRGTTRHHIPEDDTLHNHRCENLKSYIGTLFWHNVQYVCKQYIFLQMWLVHCECVNDEHQMCVLFVSTTFVWNIYCLDKYLATYTYTCKYACRSSCEVVIKMLSPVKIGIALWLFVKSVQ